MERKEDSDRIYRFIRGSIKTDRINIDSFCTIDKSAKCIILKDEALLPDILRYLADNNIPLIRIEKQEATLEDIFLEAIK